MAAKPKLTAGAPEAQIRFRSGEAPGACYTSGRRVFDEMFLGGRLLSRYWNPNGQLWPEMHFGGMRWRVDQPADTFHLSINRQDLAGGYTWTAAEETPDPSAYRPRQDASGKPLPVPHGAVVLDHPAAGVKVKVHTRLDGGPFLIRWLEVTNTTTTALGITAVAPFAGLLWKHRFEEHLPAGVESPFELAYTHQFEWGREGDFWFEPLADGVKVVNGELKGRSGWGRPAFWARNRCNGQIFVCELAWGGNYEFRLDSRLRGALWGHNQVLPANREAELYFRMGLGGHDEVLRVLEPGETVATPAVHLGLFQENTDAIVQATHQHVRQVVMPAPIPGRHVEIEANHRGYLCDRERVADMRKDIDVAASIGAEMYVVDAGWYGNEPNQWGNNVGDWHDGPWMKEGGGLKAVVDHAHRQGLKFGLWVEIEAAGANSRLKQTHPDWLLKRDGQPIAGGRALDLTQPEVVAFEEGEITRLIRDLDLDMYRLDHNHCLQPAGNRVCHGFTEDLTWRYYENFYAMFDRLRAAFPGVVFQNCAGGGGRLDWGTLARFHNTELSDWMRLPRGLKILNGVTMSLPPEVLLRTFGTEVGEHVLEGDVDAQLRLCFCRPIFRGIAPSLEELTPYLRQRVQHYVALYRDIIRPTMIGGRVFHHTPFLPLAEKTPWCVLEYAAVDGGTSVAVVFRTADAGEPEYLFRPRGLDPSRRYQVTLDSAGLGWTASGRALIHEGIGVRCEQPQTSELLLFRGD
ncbi:MAG: alpha-galactosidase [Candidatus Latescibacteria bacterium]|nr:alpha-galactosidase [Candidatus Latescibacterota bacterium]